MVQPAHALHGHGQSTMEQQAHLVPERQRSTGVNGGLADEVQGKVVQGHCRLPTHAICQRDRGDVWAEQSAFNTSMIIERSLGEGWGRGANTVNT